MQALLAVLLLVATAAHGKPAQHIVGGREGQTRPFMTIIQEVTDVAGPICGGVLVHEQYVVTSASCMWAYAGLEEFQLLRVQVGVRNFTYGNEPNAEQVVGVEQIILMYESLFQHDSFIGGPGVGVSDDIALVKLATPVTLGINVQLAYLPLGHQSFEGLDCWFAGWGATNENFNNYSSAMHEVQVPVITNLDCQEYYHWGEITIQSTNICAGVPSIVDPRGPCAGDEGGPLYCNVDGFNTFAGIISYYDFTGCGISPAVCTRITSYLVWLKNNLPVEIP